jgi:hypothetical protein
MANELKITEMRYSLVRGDLVLYSHEHVVGQVLSPSGTQADSVAFGGQTQLIEVETSLACYIRVWDAAGVLTAANGHFLGEGRVVQIEVSPGQILSCKVI